MCAPEKGCGYWEDIWWTTDPSKYETSAAKIEPKSIDLYKVIKLVKVKEQVTITMDNPQPKYSARYRVRLTVSVGDPWTDLIIQVENECPKNETVTDQDIDRLAPRVLYPDDSVSIETGYRDKNEWLAWLNFTAQGLNKTNCIVCVPTPDHSWPLFLTRKYKYDMFVAYDERTKD